MRNADQADQIGARRQGIAAEVSVIGERALPQPRRRQPRPRSCRHRRQIEQTKLQVRRPRARGDQEDPLPAADVHQDLSTLKRGDVQNVGDICGQRVRHQRGVAGRRIARDGRRRLCPRIGPIGGEFSPAPAPAQKAKRVGHVGVEIAVMGDHFAQARIAEQRRALGAGHVRAAPCVADQIERDACAKQPVRRVFRRGQRISHLREGQRAFAETLQKLRLHHRRQDLRIDKARRQIEQGPRLPGRDEAKGREPCGEAVESRVGQEPVAPGQPETATADRRARHAAPFRKGQAALRLNCLGVSRTAWACTISLRPDAPAQSGMDATA